MTLPPIVQQVRDQIQSRWEAVKESSAYVQMRERYDNLSPNAQRGLLIGLAVIGLWIIFSIPFGMLGDANQSIASFEEKKSQIKDLMDVTHDLSSLPALPPALEEAQLKSQVDQKLQSANLTPEQIKRLEIVSGDAAKSPLTPANLSQHTVNVQVEKLNLKQIVDVQYAIQELSPLVRILSADIRAHANDNHYYDLSMDIASFTTNAPPPAPPIKGGSKTPTKKINPAADKET